jgi:hypothetical protein
MKHFGGPPPGPFPNAGGIAFNPDAQAGPEVVPDFLRPSEAYITPTSGFFFGQVLQSPDLLDFLPQSRDFGDRLMRRYLDAVHPIARCVHRPSLEVEYAGFWDDIVSNYEPRASVQAVVFAAWFSAAVSLDEDTVSREYGMAKAKLVEAMKIGTETALSKANFLRTTRVETMQAFVMYMVCTIRPLCRFRVGNRFARDSSLTFFQ